ncbi:hypothetical protein BJY52DRAFT_1184053 [Lactarius psammicola]|nr:hypothetical protein BJY52DRAFT_1184053 [Lactarius psammicola]
MRTTAATAVAVLCFAAQVAPSCATPFRERAAPLASTAVTGLFNEFTNQNRSISRRDMLEVLEARVNQELATRKYRRELVAALLDMRSLNELD